MPGNEFNLYRVTFRKAVELGDTAFNVEDVDVVSDSISNAEAVIKDSKYSKAQISSIVLVSSEAHPLLLDRRVKR